MQREKGLSLYSVSSGLLKILVLSLLIAVCTGAELPALLIFLW